MIGFACGNCGKAYRVDDRFAGKKAACKACGTINLIPAAGTEPEQATSKKAAARAGQSPDELAGAIAEIPPVPAAPRKKPAPRPLEEEDQFEAALEAAAALETGGGNKSACPGCGGALPAEAVFCTGCGYNLRTGRQAATKVIKTLSAPGPGMGPAGSAGGRGAAGDGQSNGMATTLLIMGTLAWIYPLFGMQLRVFKTLGGYSPLAGAICCALGGMMYVFGQRWILSSISGVSTIAGLIIFATVGQAHFDRAREWEELEKSMAEKAEEIRRDKVRLSEASSGGAGESNSGTLSGSSSGNTPPPSAPPSSAPPPALSDFYHEGKPKIALESFGGGIFTDAMVKPLPVPSGADPVAFYRPGLKETNPQVRLATVRVLAYRIPAPHRSAGVAAASELVTDPDLKVRLEVVRAQESARHDGAARTLVAALSDKDSAVCDAAIRALAKFPDESAVEPLVMHFPQHAATVKQTLAAMGPTYRNKAAEAFAALAAKNDTPNRRAVMDEVWASYKELGGPALIHFLDDTDAVTRADAMAKIVELKYEPALERIAARLGSDGAGVVTAVAGFGPAGERAALARLTAQGGDPKARVAALAVLNLVGTKQNSLEPAKVAAGDDDIDVAKAAREVWRKLDPAALPPMEEAMMDLAATPPRRQLAAMEMLARLTSAKAEQRDAIGKRILELATNSQDPAVLDAARKGLAKWASPEVRAAALDLLKPDGDEAKRRSAIALFSVMREPQAAAALCALLEKNQSTPEVSEALKKMGDAGEDGLVRILASTSDEAVAIKVCEVLGVVGTRKCVATLAQTAVNTKGKFPAVCEAAKAARIIVEKRVGMR